jgi:hypothetical protein
MHVCLVPPEAALAFGLELAAIDIATLDRLSRCTFPRFPPQLFRIHIPDSMHECLVPREVVPKFGLVLAVIHAAPLDW